MGNISPDRVYDCLDYLVKNHPAYRDIKIVNKKEWMKKYNSSTDDNGDSKSANDNEDSSDCDDGKESEQATDGQNLSNETSENNNNNFEEANENQKDPDETESNDFTSNTCLYPKEPASNIIVNYSKKKKRVKKKRKGGKVYDYAPGQEFVPTNWIREKNHDEIAFPELYTDGKGGVHDETRQVKISRPDFYSQKFLNHNKMYAQNSEYLFVSQQHLERHLLENNISVSGQKGKPEKGQDGTTTLTCTNAFDVFSKIPGTPSYWKNFRNELFAR